MSQLKKLVSDPLAAGLGLLEQSEFEGLTSALLGLKNTNTFRDIVRPGS